MEQSFYTSDNIRANVGNGVALLFLTGFGIDKFGKISFINLCDEGDEIGIGEAFGDCEAAKGVFDLISPAEGVVLRVNDSILENPSSLTEETFLAEIKLNGIAANLMDYDGYKKYISTQEAKYQSPRNRKV